MRYALVLALFCMFWPVASGAGHRVLLIGVTDYAPEVIARAGALQGPANDVALMAEVFTAAGVPTADLTVLSDAQNSGSAAQSPTRSNIMQALEHLARTAAEGDRITIYLAGHGAQVAATADPTEPDGLDEVFLPHDFNIEPDGSFRNMIRDDEIGHLVDQMIAAGADVWLIADTCHSGSLRRSAGKQAVARFVNLMPDAPPHPQAGPLIDVAPPGTGRAGQFVGFYAAAPGMLAYETKPEGADTIHGLLTWSLSRALRSGDAQTYADLARLVSAQLWQAGGGLSSPQFIGAVGGDHAFAETNGTARTYGFKVDEGIIVTAGKVDGVSKGAIFQIEDTNGSVLFDLTVSQVALTQARATLPEGPLPGLDARLQTEGLDPARFRARWLADRSPNLVARLQSVPLDVSLRVGLAGDPLPQALQTDMGRLFDTLAPAVNRDDLEPDIEIVLEDDQTFLRPAPLGAEGTMTFQTNADMMPALENALRRMVKTRALLAAAEALNETMLAQSLAVEVFLVAGTDDGTGSCMSNGEPRQISLAQFQPQIVRHCDTVVLDVQNNNAWPVDVSAFYLAADYQVYFLTGFEGAERGGWRIPPGQTRNLSYVEATRTLTGQGIATGQMHLALFAQRAEPGQTPFDLRYLQDTRPVPGTRAAPDTTLSSVLAQTGFGLVKRRSIDNTIAEQSGAWILPLETTPDQNGGPRADPEK